MNSRIAAGLGFLAFCVVLTGCNSNGTIDTGSAAPTEVRSPGELVAQARPPVPDIPVPIGFSLDEGSSRSSSRPGLRWIVHTYKGSPDKWATGRFYKRQMEVYGWQLKSDRNIQGTIYLQFAKPGQECEIKITDGSWFTNTVIHVDAGSVAQGA